VQYTHTHTHTQTPNITHYSHQKPSVDSRPQRFTKSLHCASTRHRDNTSRTFFGGLVPLFVGADHLLSLESGKLY